MRENLETRPDESILGLSTSELAGLSADDLTDNPTAIRMILHCYRQLVGENSSLRRLRMLRLPYPYEDVFDA